jgi:glycerol-3-phosphate O-acyltransferase
MKFKKHFPAPCIIWVISGGVLVMISTKPQRKDTLTMKTIKLNIKDREIGQEDYYYVNEDNMVIATFFRNANMHGYVLYFYVPELMDQTAEAGSLMEASSILEKKLKRAGYRIKNPHFISY